MSATSQPSTPGSDKANQQSFQFSPPFNLNLPDMLSPCKEELLSKKLDDITKSFKNFSTYFYETFARNYDSTVKMVQQLISTTNETIKFVNKTAVKVNDQDKRLLRLEKNLEILQEDINDCSNSAANKNADFTIDQEKADVSVDNEKIDHSVKTSSKKRTKRAYIYGTSPTHYQKIPKKYIVAVSKIPNKDEFDENWLQEEMYLKFDQKEMDMEILNLERVAAKIKNAATKTFKIVLSTTDENINATTIYQEDLWPEGLKISRFRVNRSRFSTIKKKLHFEVKHLEKKREESFSTFRGQRASEHTGGMY